MEDLAVLWIHQSLFDAGLKAPSHEDWLHVGPENDLSVTAEMGVAPGVKETVVSKRGSSSLMTFLVVVPADQWRLDDGLGMSRHERDDDLMTAG